MGTILISNQGNLSFNSQPIPSKEKNDFFTKYYLRITDQIQLKFESREEFEERYFLVTFPIAWDEAKQTFFLGIKNQNQLVQLEICKKLIFNVKFPFQVNWQSKTHVKGLVIKSYLANLPDAILNAIIKPIGKFKKKKDSNKDSITCIIQLTNLKPNGSFVGSIEYQFKPVSWLLSTSWGKKRDYDRKVVQKYTPEQKFWRFPQEFEKIIQPLSVIDDVYTIAKKVYEIARETITIEVLDYRKGVLNLLHDMRGDCDEFTDLMVVLLRKLSFPVRRVTGMTYDFITGKIVHHAWPEIYSPAYKTWIPIDAAMNYFGYQSLGVIPMKIEGTTVLPSQLHVNFLDPMQKIDLDLKLLDTEITISLKKTN